MSDTKETAVRFRVDPDPERDTSPTYDVIDEHDRAWTPYFDDDGAHAAGYRYATESILTGMRGVIAESLEAGL